MQIDVRRYAPPRPSPLSSKIQVEVRQKTFQFLFQILMMFFQKSRNVWQNIQVIRDRSFTTFFFPISTYPKKIRQANKTNPSLSRH
jgi:hypothetical protein